MDGTSRDVPKVRISTPILEDYAHVARNMRPDEIEQFLAYSGIEEYRPDTAARALAMLPGPSYTLLDRSGYPFLVGGFEPIHPGVFHGWMMGTMDGWEGHGKTITRVCRRFIDQMLRTDAHRVQLAALTTRTQAHDWYERGLGMEREGILRSYTASGADVAMFAKVRR